MPNPFGEEPVPWWRLRRRDRPNPAPKRYTIVAAGLGPMMRLLVEAPPGIDRSAWNAIVAGLTLIPPLVVELWWKRRCRTRAEQLLSVPSALAVGMGPGPFLGRRDG